MVLVPGAEPPTPTSWRGRRRARGLAPGALPYLPEAHQAVLAAAIRERAPDLVVLENTTAGYDLGAAAAATTGLPFAGYCIELALQNGEAEATSAMYGGQLQATLRIPLPAVFSVNSTALHEEPQAAGRGERSQLAPPPELDSLKTTFVEAVAPADEGVDLDQRREDRLRGPWHRRGREHSRSPRSSPTRSAPSWGPPGPSSIRAGCPRCVRSASRGRT